MNSMESKCPGCGLMMPADPQLAYDGYYNCTAECWSVYAEVLAFEYGNIVAFSQAHQLTVDTYAVQHAGGRHKAKSVAVHLAGLYAAYELEMPRPQIPKLLQTFANHYTNFPDLTPPPDTGSLTILDVALAEDQLDHVTQVKRWSQQVWHAWGDHHAAVAALVAEVV
ncbi:MAG: DUF5946 family protein [Ardenticatenaceae bacterium]|nr:DUF5946 family protein [Ardenticatenaceae bacterium]